jgi:muramoyltetrapeptide carboxypeptidase
MIIPPYLKPGANIGITCPAGAVELQDMKYMFHQLQDWGFTYTLGSTVGSNYFKFSATDEERRADLQAMLDDNTIDAILFGRGGYGVVRIIDTIDFTTFAEKPKWLVGYSDITCLHTHIHSNYGIATLHAHMCGGYKPDGFDIASTQSIYDALVGKLTHYNIAPHAMNKIGEAEGVLIGGNLALLSDLVGTNSDIDTDGKILFIEDIAEYKYNIDRMLWQLKKANKLSNLAGLIVGGFTDTQDNETPFCMTEYEIVLEKVKDYSYPVCFDFPVGHQPKNWALKCGVQHILSIEKNRVSLKEPIIL